MAYSGALSSAKGICTRIVGSSLGNSVKWPAIMLADLRSAAISTDDRSVPGIAYATWVSGRCSRRTWLVLSRRPSGTHTEPWFSVPAVPAVVKPGEGAVILTSPFKTTDSLRLSSQQHQRYKETAPFLRYVSGAHWTCGAQASPTVVRGSIRDQVATVVLPRA